MEFLNPNLNKLQFEDLRAFSRQLQQKNEIIQRYEEELLNESNLVKSLEERMSFLQSLSDSIPLAITINDSYHSPEPSLVSTLSINNNF